MVLWCISSAVHCTAQRRCVYLETFCHCMNNGGPSAEVDCTHL